MKKKNIILIIILVLLVVLLIPKRFMLKDGGSIQYKAIFYEYTKIHRISTSSSTGYEDGWELKILGIHIGGKVDTHINTEHIITIRANDKIINANTGSFCYKDGNCIDKIDFQDFNYDALTTYYDNKLYIDNLDGNIKSIRLFDYSSKEFINTKVEFNNEYIITPNIKGTYIIEINATYDNRNITYYFMCNINKDDGKDIDIKMILKDNTLSKDGLTLIIKNDGDMTLYYSNPYHIEVYSDGYFKTLNFLKDVAFNLPLYNININESKEIQINWIYEYDKLPKGKYRLVKEFSYKENDNYISFNKYLEFEIND